MATTTQNISRTTHLLALMKKGDDAFNARDFAAMKAAHHPDMIAHITGSSEPIRGQPSARRGDEEDDSPFPRRTRLQRPLQRPFLNEKLQIRP
jgi:hypothetical protein